MTSRVFSGLLETTSMLRLPAEVTTITPIARTIWTTSSARGLRGQRGLQDQLALTTRASFWAA